MSDIPKPHPPTASAGRRPTIIDVARHAGVSKTSVSRYLGPEKPRLSTAMQQRIEHAIQQLGFRPDRLAASLRGNPTQLIGALVADIRNPYSVSWIHAAERACQAAGYSLLVCNTDNDETLEQRHLEALDAYNVDGLLINTSSPNSPMLAALHQRQSWPVVLVDRQLAGARYDMVGLDNQQAVACAIRHLLSRGFQHLVMLSQPIGQVSSRQARAHAFQTECRQHGCSFTLHEIEPTRHDNSHLVQLIQQLQHHGQPTALLCANGVITLAVCHVLQQQQAFADLGVLGIDELDWCALAGPGITTLAQPVTAIGRQAVNTLLQRIHGQNFPPQLQQLPAKLIVRGSTRPPSRAR